MELLRYGGCAPPLGQCDCGYSKKAAFAIWGILAIVSLWPKGVPPPVFSCNSNCNCNSNAVISAVVVVTVMKSEA